MSARRTSFLHVAGRLALAAVLVWAGVLKLADPAAFAENIMNFRIVPWTAAVALALYVPWLELIVAGAMVLPRARCGALVVATGLFALFAVLWAVTWARGIDVACGCFGGEGRTSAVWALARTVALAGMSAWLSHRTQEEARALRAN